jgi:uncharacterized membrane protein YccC
VAATSRRDLSAAARSTRWWSPRWWWSSPIRRRALRHAIKVTLSAMISTAIAQALGLPVPWFATISSIVAVEVTLRVSFRSARNSLLGAVVGALAGLALATVAKDQVWAVGLVVLASFVVFGLARLDQVARQAALVASVIVLIPASTGLSTPEFALVRLVETLIGITVALVVNAVVMPPRAYRGARRHLGEAFGHLAEMYRLVVAAEATGVRDAPAVVAARRSFRASFRAADALWDEAMSERAGPEELGPHWRSTLLRVWEMCAAMDDAVMDSPARGQLDGARDQLRALAERTASAMDEVSAVMTSSDTEPVPSFPELERLRGEVLDRVRTLEVHASALTFAEALQAFTFVNSMTVIAARLDDLAVPAPEGGATEGDASDDDAGDS